MSNARTNEIMAELRARGALNDGIITARELAEYGVSVAAATGHSQIIGNWLRDASSNPDIRQARNSVRFALGELLSEGIPVVATESEVLQAVRTPSVRAGLRGIS